MIRGGFLSAEDRSKLIALVRDGSTASRVTRRANAVVLLDDGWSCQEVADVLLLNDDTIRGWHNLFEQRGIEGLTGAVRNVVGIIIGIISEKLIIAYYAVSSIG